jgi:YhcH/YjgK/YiaL family protein
MILDSLDHRDCYKDIPGLKDILDAIASIHKENMLTEKLVIDGENSFINPVSFTTKNLSETRFEAHRKYADIHCVIEGTEEIIVSDIRNVKEIESFSLERDIGFYQGDNGTICILKPGDFLVCFPQDAHRVAIAPGNPSPITKVVGKLRVK